MNADDRLELFFSQSLDGFFFMMIDEPVQWDDSVDKESVLDYVFEHQRVTKVNDAMLAQYGATRESFLGTTPRDLFQHNLAHGRRVWREFFDHGRLHVETDERRLDGTPIKIEGDYLCFYDAEGRITGHFGIQRDVTERERASQCAATVQPPAARAARHSPGHPRVALAGADRGGHASTRPEPDSLSPRQRGRVRPDARERERSSRRGTRDTSSRLTAP